jgi:hypothetical protein
MHPPLGEVYGIGEGEYSPLRRKNAKPAENGHAASSFPPFNRYRKPANFRIADNTPGAVAPVNAAVSPPICWCIALGLPLTATSAGLVR